MKTLIRYYQFRLFYNMTLETFIKDNLSDLQDVKKKQFPLMLILPFFNIYCCQPSNTDQKR